MTTTHGFELLREQQIPELNSTARLYRHARTGARLLSLSNEDENKCFGITFRTPASDSTGVAHILEHAVLCGSRKYPLKDPFIELAKGSLNTFLNAFTYPDKTCYPVASQNLQDFYNLVEVYLDTVFYPRLTPQTFQEQGWHYEVETPGDPLTYKGVVFNEMKGAYSSPDRLLFKQVQTSLFPDTIYHVDSGGDPRHIPDLTYEQLKAFHRAYYHPSNSFIFVYGDDDPDARLRLLDDTLKDFEPLPINSAIPLQTRFSAPKRLTASYAVGEGEEAANGRKAMVSLNWLLPETTDAQRTLELALMEQVLLGTPAAPLRKALIDSGLGEDLTGSGLDADLRQMIFLVGLKGIAAEDAEKVEKLILETLENLAHNGIDLATVEAAMNTVEFALRENNTGSFPRGLALMLRALTSWLYDGDPLAPLAYEAPLAAVKAKLQTGRLFENLIREHLLNNAHRTTILLTPDSELTARETQEEQSKLEQARAKMGEADIQAAVETTRLLKQLQATPDPPEVLATLPALKLADLDKQSKTIPIEMQSPEGVPTLYHDLFTNGILYFDIGLNLRAVPQELLPYLPLFGRALLEVGTEKEDFVQLMQRIGQKTGGIRQQPFYSAAREQKDGVYRLFLRGKATPAQAPDLFAILRDVLTTARLDNRERFKQMALESKARLETQVVPSGSAYVSRRLRAHFSEADWVAEQTGGISYLFFLRELVPQIDSDWPGVLARLERIRSLVINRSAMLCNVTLDEANWKQTQPALAEFLASLPTAEFTSVSWSPNSEPRREGLTVPSQVNYVGKAANLYELGYKLHGSSFVILNYLGTSWLWDKVRKEGGAYGVSCGLDRLSGVFGFSSYRDPNLLQTLETFDASSRFLRELDLSQSELTRAIVGSIGDMDAYQLPDAKGFTSLARYLTNYPDDLRQQMRDEILSTKPADFRAFADALEQVKTRGLVGVVGSQAAIEAANAERPGLFEIVKVL